MADKLVPTNSADCQGDPLSRFTGNSLQEYADQARWVVWRSEVRRNKPTKVPYVAAGGARTMAKSNDRSTWRTLQEAQETCLAAKCDGIGIMLGDGLAGVDLDMCIKEDGSLLQWAGEILDCVNAYAEISPSGRGLKIFFRHDPGLDLRDWSGKTVMGAPTDGKTPAVERFCRGRYFTVTGAVFEDYDRLDDVPVEALEQVRTIAARHAPAPPEEPEQAAAKDWTPPSVALEMARSALAAIPFDPAQMPRDLWIRLGLALKRYGEDAWPVWLEACARYPGDDPDEDREVWDGLKPVEGGVTARTILREAMKHGWSQKTYEDEVIEKMAAHGVAQSDLAGVVPELTDYLAYLPKHDYIYRPTGNHHPLAAVNATVPHPSWEGKTIKPSLWLDKQAPIHIKTWAPGYPTVIKGRGINNSGWYDHAGVNTYNEYRAPVLKKGNADDAGWWLEMVRFAYPDDADHIIAFLAHRVQYPGVKINHGLVLLGTPGIGKDSILEPARRAVGEWNCKEIAPHLLINNQFNPYIKSVILRINEAQDQGEINRYQFYERTKTLLAAPPMTLPCNEKHVGEQYVLNVTGVVITSNYTHNSLYLPADDRRHYVAVSERKKEDRGEEYWTTLWSWYEAGGFENVAAYLAAYNLTGFNASAPPPLTAAFWNIVNSERSSEDNELDDALDKMGRPAAVTLDMLRRHVGISLQIWLGEAKNRRAIPHRLEVAGYTPVQNPAVKDKQWVIGGKRQPVYGNKTLSVRERIDGAIELTNASKDDPRTKPLGSNITKLEPRER